MPIISITSDWGGENYRLPRMKGMIRSSLDCIGDKLQPEKFQVEEISNSIKPFDIRSACFVLKHSFSFFSKGSIHLICVRCESLSVEGLAVVEIAGHYFVGANDGRFSLLSQDLPDEVFIIEPDSDNDNTCSLFAKAIVCIVSGRIGEQKRVQLKRVANEVPVVMKDKIIGHVVFIDNYGNAVTDISKSLFVKSFLSAREIIGKEPDFSIFVHGPYLELDFICSCYRDVDSGCTAALFNSLDLLELGIRNGNLAAMENIDTTTEIIIQWKIM